MPDPSDAALSELRREVDLVDRELVRMLAERRRLVARLAEAKRHARLEAVDPTREAELHARWAEHAEASGLPAATVSDVLEAILGSSRAHVAALLAEPDDDA
jgi:chorismate mutase/prephenate dehydrogenase